MDSDAAAECFADAAAVWNEVTSIGVVFQPDAVRPIREGSSTATLELKRIQEHFEH